MGIFNITCPVVIKPEDNTPFISDGNLNFKDHYVGWIVAGFCTLIASAVSIWLISKHAQYYTKPLHQRYIIRLLLMVPIYSIVSWLSYVFYKSAIYFQLLRDCYEAIVLGSFFYLLMQYLADDPVDQREIFRHKEINGWPFPLNYVKYRPTGLYFLQLIKWCILQYVVLRPLCTFLAVITLALGVYCVDSYSPVFSHIYLSLIISVSVSVAMYALIAFYFLVKKELCPHNPLSKFLCIKAVIFLTFWQDSFLSVLIHFGVIKDSQFWSADNVETGISALLECAEMVLFAFLHVKAFTYRRYRPADHSRTSVKAALLDALNIGDVFREIGGGFVYLVRRMTGKPVDVNRGHDLEVALGKRRRSEQTVRVPLITSKEYDEKFKEGDGIQVTVISSSDLPDSLSSPSAMDMRLLSSSSRSTKSTDESISRSKIFQLSHSAAVSKASLAEYVPVEQDIVEDEVVLSDQPFSSNTFSIKTPAHHHQQSSESESPLPPLPLPQAHGNEIASIRASLPSDQTSQSSRSSISQPRPSARDLKRPRMPPKERSVPLATSEQYGPGAVSSIKVSSRTQRTGHKPLSEALQGENLPNVAGMQPLTNPPDIRTLSLPKRQAWWKSSSSGHLAAVAPPASLSSFSATNISTVSQSQSHSHSHSSPSVASASGQSPRTRFTRPPPRSREHYRSIDTGTSTNRQARQEHRQSTPNFAFVMYD